MKILKRTHNLLFCSVGLLLFSCKISAPNQQNTSQQLPADYKSIKDSTNVATLNWRTYFEDKDLTSLIDSALKTNLDLLSALQKLEILRSGVKISNSMLFPIVNGYLSAGQRKYGLYTMDGAGNISTEITKGQTVPIHLPDYYIGLQTSWELDVWGKLRNKKKSAVARYLAGIEGKNLTVTGLVSEIARMYYELLALDNELDIINETISLQTNALAIVVAQKESGYLTSLAVNQFEAQLLNSKALQIKTEQAITECENKINFLLGRLPQKISRKKEMFQVALPSNIQAGIPADLLTYRPDIRQAEYELLAAKADVKAARAAFYPNFNITGAFGYQAFKTGFLFLSPESVAYTLLGGLTSPLINRAAIKREFKNANANQLTALYNYQKSIINGYMEVYNELLNVNRLGQIYELKTQEAEILRKSIEASTELYSAGRANYLEVLMTQRNALESRLDLINTRKMQHYSVIQVYKALGGGWQ